jgi:hypothetical protein
VKQTKYIVSDLVARRIISDKDVTMTPNYALEDVTVFPIMHVCLIFFIVRSK